MLNREFDEIIRGKFEDFEAAPFDPAQWNKMEDKLHAQEGLFGKKHYGRTLLSNGLKSLVLGAVIGGGAVFYYQKQNLDQNKSQISSSETVYVADIGNLANEEPLKTERSESNVAQLFDAVGFYSGYHSDKEAGSKSQALLNINQSEKGKELRDAKILSTKLVQEIELRSVNNSKIGDIENSNELNNLNLGSLMNSNLSGTSQLQSNFFSNLDGCEGKRESQTPIVLVNNDTVTDYNILAIPCKPLVVEVLADKKNSGEQLEFVTDVQKVFPRAQISNNAKSLEGILLSWTPSVSDIRPTPYQLKVLFTNPDCPKQSRYITIQITVSSPFFYVIQGDTTIEKGQGANLGLEGNLKGCSIIWEPNDGSISNIHSLTPEVRPLSSTVYRVKVRSREGCVYSDSLKVNVVSPIDEDVKRVLAIPNIFTPNGDGINDFFEIPNMKNGLYQLEVFDRWGKLVFKSENYDNRWDAKGVKNDTYFYIITEKLSSGKNRGWVEVSR